MGKYKRTIRRNTRRVKTKRRKPLRKRKSRRRTKRRGGSIFKVGDKVQLNDNIVATNPQYLCNHISRPYGSPPCPTWWKVTKVDGINEYTLQSGDLETTHIAGKYLSM